MLHFISLYGKKSSGRHLILVALLLCSLSPSWAQTSVTRLLINGLPCLLDSVANTYYSTLGADPAFPASLSVAWDEGRAATVSLDGQAVPATGGTVTLGQLEGTHTVALTDTAGRVTQADVCFTLLPLVSLDSVPDVVDRTKRACHYSLLAAPGTGNLPDGQVFDHTATIKIRGASSAVYPKKSYGIEICDSEGEEVDAALLGYRDDGDWILEAMYADRAKMRKQLCFDIWLAHAGQPVDDAKYSNGIRGQLVEVLQNGRWRGVYILSEKVDRKQLGLKKIDEEDDGTLTVRGISYKGEAWDNGTAISLRGYDDAARTDTIYWQGWEQDYPDEDGVFTWQYLKDLIDAIVAMDAQDDATFCRQVESLFDLDNAIDYLLFLEAVNAVDNNLKNTFLSTYNVQKGSKWFFTPWDLDATFGRMPDGSASGLYAFTEGGQMERNALFSRILRSSLRDRVCDRWRELSQTVYAPSAIKARIERYAYLLERSGAWARELAQWPSVPDDLAGEVSFMENWYDANFAVMNSKLGNTSVGIRPSAGLDGVSVAVADGVVTVGNAGTGDVRLTVYNAEGRRLLSAGITGSRQIALGSGTYVLRIEKGDAVSHEKILMP